MGSCRSMSFPMTFPYCASVRISTSKGSIFLPHRSAFFLSLLSFCRIPAMALCSSLAFTIMSRRGLRKLRIPSVSGYPSNRYGSSGSGTPFMAYSIRGWYPEKPAHIPESHDQDAFPELLRDALVPRSVKSTTSLKAAIKEYPVQPLSGEVDNGTVSVSAQKIIEPLEILWGYVQRDLRPVHDGVDHLDFFSESADVGGVWGFADLSLGLNLYFLPHSIYRPVNNSFGGLEPLHHYCFIPLVTIIPLILSLLLIPIPFEFSVLRDEIYQLVGCPDAGLPGVQRISLDVDERRLLNVQLSRRNLITLFTE